MRKEHLTVHLITNNQPLRQGLEDLMCTYTLPMLRMLPTAVEAQSRSRNTLQGMAIVILQAGQPSIQEPQISPITPSVLPHRSQSRHGLEGRV